MAQYVMARNHCDIIWAVLVFGIVGPGICNILEHVLSSALAVHMHACHKPKRPNIKQGRHETEGRLYQTQLPKAVGCRVQELPRPASSFKP